MSGVGDRSPPPAPPLLPRPTAFADASPAYEQPPPPPSLPARPSESTNAESAVSPVSQVSSSSTSAPPPLPAREPRLLERARRHDAMQFLYAPHTLSPEQRRSYLEVKMLESRMHVEILSKDRALCVYEELMAVSGDDAFLVDIVRPGLGISKRRHDQTRALMNFLENNAANGPLSNWRLTLMDMTEKLPFESEEHRVAWQRRTLAFIHNQLRDRAGLTERSTEHLAKLDQMKDIITQFDGQKPEDIVSMMKEMLTATTPSAALPTPHLFDTLHAAWMAAIDVLTDQSRPAEIVPFIEQMLAPPSAEQSNDMAFQQAWSFLRGVSTSLFDSTSLSQERHLVSRLVAFSLLYQIYINTRIISSDKCLLNMMHEVLPDIVERLRGVDLRTRRQLFVCLAPMLSDIRLWLERMDLELARITTKDGAFVTFCVDAYFQLSLVLGDETPNDLCVSFCRAAHEIHFSQWAKYVETRPPWQQQLLKYCQDYMGHLEFVHERFLPAVRKYVRPSDAWTSVLNDRHRTFYAGVINLLADRTATDAPLDGGLIDGFKHLTTTNRMIYALAMDLLGSEEAILRADARLFDVYALIHPHMKAWFSQIHQQCESIVDRCVHSDKGECQDEDLNVSSSVLDLFEYLRTMVDVYFSVTTSASDVAIHSTKFDAYLNGETATISNFLPQLMTCLTIAMERYALALIDRASGIDLDDPSFHVFSTKRPGGKPERLEITRPTTNLRSGERAPIDKDMTLRVFRRVNNLVCAGKWFDEKVGGDLRRHGERVVTIPDKVWADAVQRASTALDHSILQLLIYLAKRMVYIDLREDFIDGLYATADVSLTSLTSISSIIVGLIEEIFGCINNDGNDDISYWLLIMFFRHFLHAYECVLVVDPHAGRWFSPRDLPVFLTDLDRLQDLFTTPHSPVTRKMLPKHAVVACTATVRGVVRALFALPTATLVEGYDRARKERRSSAGSTTPSLPSRQQPPQKVHLSVYDVCTVLESEERREQHQAQSAGEPTRRRHLHVIKHPLHLFHMGTAATTAHSTNPFLSDVQALNTPMESPWQEAWLVGVIARRAGYGHPSYYHTSAVKSLFKRAVSRNGTVSSHQEPVAIDHQAVTFMKSMGMKKWLGFGGGGGDAMTEHTIKTPPL